MFIETIGSLVDYFLLIAMSSTAYSADGLYITGKLGIAIPNNSEIIESAYVSELNLDTGFASAFAIGFDFNNNLRIESEFAYQQNNIDSDSYSKAINNSGDVTALIFGINGYYDFYNKSKFIPFLSAGIGLANFDFNNFETHDNIIASDDDNVFSYKIGGGIGYEVTERATIDLTYWYNGFSDLELGYADATYSSHNISLGLRISM